MPYANPANRRRQQREYYRTHVQHARKKHDPDRTSKKILVATRLPVELVARIQRIVAEGIATGRFPWRTQSAAIGALLMKGMESMAGDESMDEMLPYLRAIQTIEHVGQHRNEAQAAMSKIKTEVSELLAIKANDEAVQYFHAMYESIDQMNANVWRDWLLTQLRQTFPQLVKQKPKGVSFIDRREKKSARALLVERRKKVRES